jgi:translation elongation factor P/translation initiation factor 5A
MKIINQHMIESDHKGLDRAEYRRLAGRTQEQFKEDIKQGHRNEKIIIERYAKFYKQKTGKELHIIDNGVDNTGEFLEIKKVRDDADFILNGKPVEVKIIKDKLFTFRLKLNLLKSYIKQDANVLIVLGWETDSPEFTILDKETLKHVVRFGKKTISGDWEGKPTVTLYRNSYDWTLLPSLD